MVNDDKLVNESNCSLKDPKKFPFDFKVENNTKCRVRVDLERKKFLLDVDSVAFTDLRRKDGPREI